MLRFPYFKAKKQKKMVIPLQKKFNGSKSLPSI